ncbi:hypothetical protein BLOT_008359 [Blomia tropicalis]|nr:hypothetical protein BLOT_008359 [Blomia tropicalis]
MEKKRPSRCDGQYLCLCSGMQQRQQLQQQRQQKKKKKKKPHDDAASYKVVNDACNELIDLFL